MHFLAVDSMLQALTQMYSKSESQAKDTEEHHHQKYKTTEGGEDIMLRDTNPYFQDKVEGKVLNHLLQKNPRSTKEKLINWSIYNSGKQTIIVLWIENTIVVLTSKANG